MARAKSRPRSIYGVHPGVQMMIDWVVGLPAKTGKSLEQWVGLVKRDGPDDEAACRVWLKEEHGFGTNAAWWIAERAFGKGGDWDTDSQAYLAKAQEYVAQQYAGGKAGLKPLYDRLLQVAGALGADVKACPCQTIVPLYRNHVFAEVKAPNRQRVDLSLALGKYPGAIPARLIDTGGKEKKNRLTHRIPIAKLEEIDVEVKAWLTMAYALDA